WKALLARPPESFREARFQGYFRAARREYRDPSDWAYRHRNRRCQESTASRRLAVRQLAHPCSVVPVLAEILLKQSCSTCTFANRTDRKCIRRTFIELLFRPIVG